VDGRADYKTLKFASSDQFAGLPLVAPGPFAALSEVVRHAVSPVLHLACGMPLDQNHTDWQNRCALEASLIIGFIPGYNHGRTGHSGHCWGHCWWMEGLDHDVIG